MSEPERPLLADVRDELGSLWSELGESLRLRWELMRLELDECRSPVKRLAIGLLAATVAALSSLPVLVVCLAWLADGRLGIAFAGWLAIFGFGPLLGGILGGYLAWRRFRRRFVGLEQTLEELREDLLWIEEALGRADGEQE